MLDIAEEKKQDRNMMQIVCFRLAGEEYAAPITDISEVIKPQRITPMPQMPDFVLGVMNLRGNVVAVFDFKKIFGLPSDAQTGQAKLIVFCCKGVLFAVVVDEVLDTIKIGLSELEAIPERKTCIKKECVKGMALLEKRMVIILDVDKICSEIDSEISDFRHGK
ncbi:MAG TPA: hypothetical protein DCL35_07200 [Candidatus Omnitrophica bacterium]|nr:hypothetical protein [Candidatus Omnitrophota bacterium]